MSQKQCECAERQEVTYHGCAVVEVGAWQWVVVAVAVLAVNFRL